MSFPLDRSGGSGDPALQAILAEFVVRWDRGETPRAEDYLGRLSSGDPNRAVELIYQEFCLAELAGLHPVVDDYLKRFPDQRESLGRLLSLHDAFTSSQLREWAGPVVPLPEVGDEIGPYRLLRQLGRGGFARVFLAEQSDLDDRLVVVKVSTRLTPEPQLLARARHSHIVEVLSHATIEGGALQLVCMPFLGGATLADVLEGRRKLGVRPRSGRDLIADLDRVSAPEYPTAGRERPARNLIAGLSYAKGIAWIVARLAEALDFAYSRGVAHGDVKPSNVLLTADGVPMLLDFNLAVGWRAATSPEREDDAGGTLAYMAPERLRAVAEPGQVFVPKADDRHRADIFALGVVLVEALTGRTPDLAPGPERSAQQLAARYAESRHGEGVVAGWRSHPAIDPALRSILGRCLAPDPADRYTQAAELAEDLDRWRTDRPLAFASEPSRQYRLVRWTRRQRAVLAALLLVAGLAGLVGAWAAGRDSARQRALDHLTAYWDRTDSGVFRFVRFDRWRTAGQGDPAEIALDHLAHFQADGTGDWRQQADFQDLPGRVRDELELWILEQELRYGRAVEARPDSPDDWRHALAILDRDLAVTSLEPLEIERRRLQRRLGLPETPSAAERGAISRDSRRRWMDEYLRGIDDELELRPSEGELTHFTNAVSARPGSFWAHYRAAAVAYRLSRYAEAANHLRRCIEQRPGNSSLRVQLAGCLFEQGRYIEALDACDRAIALTPNDPEPYYSRSYIRERMGQKKERDADLRRFETLARRQGKAPRGSLRMFLMFAKEGNGAADERENMARRILDIDPDDVDARVMLADSLMRSGKREDAARELERVLVLSPDHLWARYSLGVVRCNLKREGVENAFEPLIRHPRFEEFVRQYPIALNSFHLLSWVYLRKGEVKKGLETAREGLGYSERLQILRGESEYALARAFAAAAEKDPSQQPQVREHLRTAVRLNPDYAIPYLDRDPLMKPYRDEFTAEGH